MTVRATGVGVLLAAILIGSVWPRALAWGGPTPESTSDKAVKEEPAETGAVPQDGKDVPVPSAKSDKDLADRRDPFRPFLRKPMVSKEPEGELIGVTALDLQQLTLVGVLLDMNPPRALLQDSSGMGYVVTPGTRVGRSGGVVAAIEPGRMTVEEKTLDLYEREQVTRQVLEISQDIEARAVTRKSKAVGRGER